MLSFPTKKEPLETLHIDMINTFLDEQIKELPILIVMSEGLPDLGPLDLKWTQLLGQACRSRSVWRTHKANCSVEVAMRPPLPR